MPEDDPKGIAQSEAMSDHEGGPKEGYLKRAERRVSEVSDPELRKLAFQAELTRIASNRTRPKTWRGYVIRAAPGISKVLAAVSLMVGLFLSVRGYLDTRDKEAHAREQEAKAREAEALKPFVDIRRERYIEVLHVLGTI